MNADKSNKEIEIRCKTCGSLQMKVEIVGKFKYDYVCKKCKQSNKGIITRKF